LAKSYGGAWLYRKPLVAPEMAISGVGQSVV